MVTFLKNNSCCVFCFLFLLSIFPFLGLLPKNNVAKKYTEELFSPDLLRINSMDKAIEYIDSVYTINCPGKFDTLNYVRVVTKFTKERFFHGLSNYSLSDNWIAFLSGKFLWTHMYSLVDPEDILKHPEGLCSQQTIVFMEILKRKNIHVRSVGLGYEKGPGHFVAEVHYNNAWHLHDVTIEPVWSKVVNHHQSMDYYLINKDSLYLAYEDKYNRPLFNKLLEKVIYGEVDDFPAKNMLLFHHITLVITYLLPLFFLSMMLLGIFRKNNKCRKYNFSKITNNEVAK